MKIERKLELMNIMFNPKSVALIGASDSLWKIGGSVVRNILACGFKKNIYAVNPNPKYKNRDIFGINVYPSLDKCPKPIDIAAVVVPPLSVIDSIKQAIECDIRTAVIITAGFGEVRSDDRQRQNKELISIAEKAGMIFVGPNSLGIYSSEDESSPLHLGMGFMLPMPGDIAIISQSGTVGSILSNMMRKIKYFISSGNEASLILEDYLEYFARDEKIKLIALFVEGLRDAKRFKRICSEITQVKPVVFLKSGATKSGARAAFSHTASIGGSLDIYESVFKQTGIIQADNITQFMYLTKAAAFFLPVPDHDPLRIGIMSGGGGFAVHLADLCERHGLSVVDLNEEPNGRKLIDEISKLLPFYWSKNNPIDMVATRGADARKIIELMVQSNCFDVINLQSSIGFMEMVKAFKPINEFSEKMIKMMESMSKDRVNTGLKREIELCSKYPNQKFLFISPISTLTNPLYFNYDDNRILVIGENLEMATIILKKLHDYQKYVNQKIEWKR